MNEKQKMLDSNQTFGSNIFPDSAATSILTLDVELNCVANTPSVDIHAGPKITGSYGVSSGMISRLKSAS